MSVKFNFILNPNTTGHDEADSSQTFYLVEQNGQWEIIDIGPYQKV